MQNLNLFYINFLLLLLLLTGCSERKTINSDIIDIAQMYETPVTIHASELIDSIRYIALETTDLSLLGEIYKIKPVGNSLFVTDRNRLHVFDYNGKYIRSIACRGQGPGEYIQISDFDISDSMVYILDGLKILVYTYDNKYVKSIRVSKVTNIVKSSSGFIGYSNPILQRQQYGQQVPNLILLDETGQTKSVLHYRAININSIPPFIHMAILKRYKNEILYYPPLQDTIFSVYDEKIKPLFILNRGQYAVKFEDVDELTKMRNAYTKGIVIEDFYLNDKWLILHCSKNYETGLYFYNLHTKKMNYTPKLINDIDKTFDIRYPVVTDEQIFEVMNPYRMLEENKLPESLRNIDPDNNPVIRIAYRNKN